MLNKQVILGSEVVQMLTILVLLLVFRLLGFIFKVAGGIIKIVFRILIFPVLILTALRGYPIIALIVGVIVIIGMCIGSAVKRR